jgi:hypothetical protein
MRTSQKKGTCKVDVKKGNKVAFHYGTSVEEGKVKAIVGEYVKVRYGGWFGSDVWIEINRIVGVIE